MSTNAAGADASLVVVAETDGFDAALQRSMATAQAFERTTVDAANGAANAVAGVGKKGAAGLGELDASQKRFLASMERQTAALTMDRVEFAKWQATVKGIPQGVIEPYIRKLQDAVDAQKRSGAAANDYAQRLGLVGVSAGQAQAALRTLPAQITDITTSLASGQSPFLVLIQQGGQIKDSFGGVGNALKALAGTITPTVALVGSLAAVVGTLGFAWASGYRESAQLRTSLALTGNAAGITAGQFNAMAKSIGDDTKAGVGVARDALQALVADGRIGAQAIEPTAKAVAALARATGDSAADIAKRFADLTGGVADGAAKLNQQFNFLTAEQYKAIKALEDHGRAQEALAETMRLLGQRIETTTQQMGAIERNWTEAKNAVVAYWDSLKALGRDNTPEEELARIKRMREELAKAGQKAYVFGPSDAELAEQQKRQQLLIDGQKYLAKAKSEDAIREQERIGLTKQVNDALSEQLKLEKQMAETRDKLSAAGFSGEQIAGVINKLVLGSKAYGDSAALAMARASAAATDAMTELAGRQVIFDAQLREGAITEVGYIEMVTQARIKALEAEKRATQARSALASDRVNRGDTGALQEVIAAAAQVRRLDAEIASARIESSSKVKQILIDNAREAYLAEFEAAEKVRDENDAIARQQFLRRKATIEAIDEQSRALGESIRLAELERSLAGATTSERQAAVEILRIQIKLQRDLDELQKNNALAAKPEELERQKQRLRDQAAQAASEVTARTAAEEWKRVFDDVRSGLYEAIRNGGKDGLRSLSSLAERLIIRPMLEPQLNGLSASITDVITGMRGNTGGTSFGGGGSLLGNSSSANNVGIELFGKDIALSDAVAAAGYLDAFMQAKAGKWGTAIGEAAGAYFGGPLGAMIGKTIGAAIDKVFAGGAGTPHMGGYVSISSTGQITDITAAQGGKQQADMQALVGTLAGQLNTALQSGAKAFGAEAGQSMRLVFEADGQDASWGIAQVLNAAGVQVAGFGAKGTFAADAKTGFTEFSNEAAQSVKQALLAIDLPKWASDALNTITTSDGADKLTTVVASIVQTQEAITDLRASLRPLGVSFAELAGLSDDAVYTLMQAAGGMDALKSGLKDYFGGFFSDSERAAMQLSAIGAELKAFGLDTLPATKEAYRALVEGQDLSTESGSKLYAALIRNAGAFASVMDAADGASSSVDKIAATLADLNGAIDRNIGKFLSGDSLRQYQAGQIQASLAGAGVNVSIEQILGATKQQVFDFAKSFVNLADKSLDAKVAVVNAAGAMADLIEAAGGASSAVSQLSGSVRAPNGQTYTAASFQAALSNITPDALAAATATYIDQRFGGESWALQWAGNATTQGALANSLALQALMGNPNAGVGVPSDGSGGQQAGEAYSDPRIERQLQSTRDLIEALDGVETNLRDYMTSLTQSDLSALSPEARLADAQAAFDQVYAQAFAGDAAAGEQVRARADDLLRAQRAYSGSGGYAPVFDRMLERLAALVDRTDQLKAETANGNRVNAAALTDVVDAVSDGNATSARALEAATRERARDW